MSKALSTVDFSFLATEKTGKVSAVLQRPEGAWCLLVLAHGAGAGMRHPFMEAVASRLAERGMASFRYQFPYMEKGRRGPNPRPVLVATVRSAVQAARDAAPGLPLLAGGKSMGGRMTSMAAAESDLPGVLGLVFLGFPLHAAGKPSQDRAGHLETVAVPMLFVQGTRDKLADLELLRPVCDGLGARAALHVVEGGDHSFHVLKRSGRTDEEALDELTRTVVAWAESLPGVGKP